MSLEEWRTEAMRRLWSTTVAAAENSHCLAVPITEPYGSRWDAIQARRLIRDNTRVDDAGSSDLDVGNLSAQWRLVDAEAWASAVRNARVGGPGWGLIAPLLAICQTLEVRPEDVLPAETPDLSAR